MFNQVFLLHHAKLFMSVYKFRKLLHYVRKYEGVFLSIHVHKVRQRAEVMLQFCGGYQAPSTLIPFKTKTELFCSVFKKICVHTYRFRIVFSCPHYNADQERSHMVASVRHFGYSRSSGLAPGGVYFDDGTVFR